MGCDIHLLVEVKKDGIWESADEWNTDDKEYIHVDYDNQLYKDRDYTLFALLADVKNYHNIKPICQPKGYPSNVSDQVFDFINYWNDDGHSHTYFTLKELIEIDWNNTIKEAGYMDNGQWKAFNQSMKTLNPDYDLRYPYSQGIGPELRRTQTWREWEVPLKTEAGNFYDVVIPKLTEMGEPENVRIVLFFDN